MSVTVLDDQERRKALALTKSSNDLSKRVAYISWVGGQSSACMHCYSSSDPRLFNCHAFQEGAPTAASKELTCSKPTTNRKMEIQTSQ